jgi:hypothetical protein
MANQPGLIKKEPGNLHTGTLYGFKLNKHTITVEVSTSH